MTQPPGTGVGLRHNRTNTSRPTRGRKLEISCVASPSAAGPPT